MLEAKKMKCINCKGDMQEITTTFNSKWGDYTVTIRGVKAHKCDQCDELVFSTEEARMIQNITAGFADSRVKEKPDLINLQETAELLRVSNQTVYNMLKDGRLSARRIGKEWRFLKDEVFEAMMGKSTVSVAARGDLSDKDRAFIEKHTGEEG
jgi:excisionase family DNA binding protein/YgiT-type zinc finger domain-containing protein